LDLGLQPGDTIAAWLPTDDVDLHVTQFGAAKAGLTLAVLDEGITKEGLAKTLEETGAKALIYAPYRGNTDNTALLQQMIPELATCE
jgi:fatty-acyl-CoA synthase